jgi:hypothetical protein
MAWYDIFYKVFNLKDRTMEHNNFNQNNFGDKDINKAWQGADIIGPSGFGVTNLDSYIQREDFNRNLNRFKNSKLLRNLTRDTETGIGE